jgi:hypothetical protein
MIGDPGMKNYADWEVIITQLLADRKKWILIKN